MPWHQLTRSCIFQLLCTVSSLPEYEATLGLHALLCRHYDTGTSGGRVIVMQAFKNAQASGQGDMQSVLQATFSALDSGFLADPRLSLLVR